MKVYRLSGATFYDCINTLYQFIKPFLDNTLRKHAYSNILKILLPKQRKFSDKNSDIFHISAQNRDCEY